MSNFKRNIENPHFSHRTSFIVTNLHSDDDDDDSIELAKNIEKRNHKNGSGSEYIL